MLLDGAQAELRHEQLNALQLPKVGYANAIDLGETAEHLTGPDSSMLDPSLSPSCKQQPTT